jgi:DNA-binding LacI/PurR family transcriptional regulator
MTTIRYSLAEMAEQAVCALLARQTDLTTTPVHLAVPVELVVRESTAGPAPLEKL